MSAASSTRKTIRPHRKSRAGCSTCKRRKVKCNEEKPCSNCIRFGLACNLVSDCPPVQRDTAPAPTPVPKRGRGRPRKIWTAPQSPQTTPTPGPRMVDVGPAPINLDNAELLLHFVTTAAGTLAGNHSPDMHQFWTRNVPHIGLSHTFVLHLVFALAAFHQAYTAKEEGRAGDYQDESAKDNVPRPFPQRQSHSDYLSLAQRHLTAGLAGFSAQLSQPGPENCGALYLGAVLTSYCTFAAGPTSGHDLLVCAANSNGGQNNTEPTAASSSASWMPFVHGVRLMHESFSPDVLFTGLMEPLHTSPPPGPLEQPVYARDGFPRLDWEAALDGLRAFIADSRQDEGGQQGATPEADESPSTAAVCLKPLESLIGIYAATYGRHDGPDGEITYDGPPENQFVFGWLYRVGAEFVACVRRREPYALLVLAHYAVLLNGNTVQRGWYVDGWKEHIIATVDGYLADESCREWMRWPMEQLPPEAERRGGSCSG